jgi:2-phospho-L-lactate transferase/gluconeogenesis factor (CofD/UPF0052 family)
VLRKKNRKLIQQADLICYPPGSFYTSLIANLLPEGVGAAIAACDSPKIYVPNLGHDPEQVGMTLEGSVGILLDYLRAGVPAECPNRDLLDFVLLDSKRGNYPESKSLREVCKRGVQVIDTRLISRESAPYYDAGLLVAALLSLT